MFYFPYKYSKTQQGNKSIRRECKTILQWNSNIAVKYIPKDSNSHHEALGLV